ncbi:MAG: hypothetical protein Q9169_006561 [Polycauliona sp. 2 TL-2023]
MASEHPSRPEPGNHRDFSNEAWPLPEQAAMPHNTAHIDTSSDVSEQETVSIIDQMSPSNIPTPNQCLFHLKLLEAFHKLREDVATTDGLYGIWDEFVGEAYPGEGLDQEKAELLLKIREKRWAIYIIHAERRYTVWFQKMPTQNFPLLDEAALTAIRKSFEKIGTIASFIFDPSTLPPLDVLMVWHAHLLHPQDFLEDCTRHRKSLLWQAGLPLHIINKCIDSATFDYHTGNPASSILFQQMTGLKWNSLEDGQGPTLTCVKCTQAKQCAWTTLVTPALWKELNHTYRGYGLADPDFSMICDSCHTTTSHETLRIHKFQTDHENLLKKDMPMPGTILNLKGRLQPVSDPGGEPPSFPNSFLKLLKLVDSSAGPVTKMDHIRKGVNDTLRRPMFANLGQKQKLAISRTMSRYWSNSSIFVLDLVGAVVRQGSFIEKMHAIEWLYSPIARSNMNRLLIKYDRYFQILRSNKKQLAVPTLDVDLAW